MTILDLEKLLKNHKLDYKEQFKVGELVTCIKYDFYEDSIEEYNMVENVQNQLGGKYLVGVGQVIDVIYRQNGYNYFVKMLCISDDYCYSFKENKLSKITDSTKYYLQIFNVSIKMRNK